MEKQVKKIVVVGAGFGGIEIAKKLCSEAVEIWVIDRNNYHNFQPLMYQVATGGLEPDSIAYPVRRIFRKNKKVVFRMAEVYEVVPGEQKLLTSVGDIRYDYLVLATGSQTNFFNFEPIKESLLTLKSMPDALNIRSYLFQNLEKALTKIVDVPVEEIMNIAIVGGGPAGLELAGALAEMKRYVLPKDFPELDLDKMHINLYQAAPRLLPNMSEEASAESLKYVKQLGINVFLNSRVTGYDGSAVTLEDGSTFLTDTVIWTAGVKGAPIKGLPEESILRGNRIRTDEYNKIIGLENGFAIGDVAAHVTDDNPRGLPMLAPVAQKQGRHLAKNLVNLIDNKPLVPFEYKSKGVMATIGRSKAVVDLPWYQFQGTFAWLVWMFIHIFSLVGFRNRAVAFMDWLGNYFSYDRPLGLIIRPFHRTKVEGSKSEPPQAKKQLQKRTIL